MKATPERDGRGTPRPPIIEELKKVDLLKAGAQWYEASRLPTVPTLTQTEKSILFLIGHHDLTQADAAALLGLSYQRTSFLFARAVRKLRGAVPE